MENDKTAEDPLCEELYTWVNELELSKPKKNLARDFSDGLIVAEILKKDFPRLVDLHNYTPANSFINKMKNWNWLNDKVLNKIGLVQSNTNLKDLAASKRTAIEKFLLTIKKKLDNMKEERRKASYTTEEVVTEDGITVVDIHIQSTVPYDEFKVIQDDLIRKEEELESLQAKVTHLEALIELKDQRLSDLVAQIKRCVCNKC